MKKKIFLILAAFTAAVTIFTSVTVAFLYYNFYKDSVISEIKTESRMIANDINQEKDSAIALASYRTVVADTRISLVDKAGNVIFDSNTNAEQLDNHKNRAEINEARQTGTGEALRYSDTFKQSAYYYALQLDDGSILRLSRQIHNITSLFNETIPLIVGIIVIVLFISIYLASVLTRSIISPIDKAVAQIKDVLKDDSDITFAIDTYDELDYFVHTIKSMRADIRCYLDTIRAERQTFDTVTKNMQEGFLLINRERRIISINNSARNMLDAPNNKDYSGQNLLLFSRNPKLHNAVDSAFKDNVRVNFSDNAHTNEFYKYFVSPVFDERLQNIGIMIFIVNITKEMKADLVRRDFAANVSHELKTPLTSIIGFAEMMESGMMENEADIKNSAARIHKEASRLIALVEDIIRLSKIENDSTSEPKEIIELGEIAKEAIDVLISLAQKKQITLNFSDENVSIKGNRSMLFELFYNLIDNAIKYNHEDGRVDIKVKKEDGNAIITVSDTGIGIHETHVERIFERFYRVDKSRFKQTGGTGLGLSIVKHVVEFHHGQIEVNSTVKVGTTITVRLPQ